MEPPQPIATIQTSAAHEPHEFQVQFSDQGSDSIERVGVTLPLAEALARSAAISAKHFGFDAVFASLWLGLLSTRDETGRAAIDLDAEPGFLKSVLVSLESAVERWPNHDWRQASDQGYGDTARVLTSPLHRSGSTRAAFERAKRLRGEQGALDVRHVCAALLGLDAHDHSEEYGQLRGGRQEAAAKLARHLIETHPNETEQWAKFYQSIFGTELPLRIGPKHDGSRAQHRPEYDADAYTERDLLDIDDEVIALAHVIASTKTQPPLSIGLFGEWGSGKSFFMSHLRRTIDDLSANAKVARQTGQQAGCYDRIAQIEFNAWHYQDGDLWASLADHILRNLRYGKNESEQVLRERTDVILKQLELNQAELETAESSAADADKQIRAAEDKVSSLQLTLEAHERKLEQELAPGAVIAGVRDSLAVAVADRSEAESVLREAGVERLGESAVDLQDAIRATQRELSAFGAIFMPLLRGERPLLRVLGLCLVLSIPFLLNALARQLTSEQWRDLAGSISGVVGLLGASSAWLMKQSKTLKDWRSRLQPVASKIERNLREQVAEKTMEQTREIAKQISAIQALRQAQALELARRGQISEDTNRLRGELQLLERQPLLRNFLDQRIGQGDYQKRLGLAALIRRDFEKLSTIVQTNNEKPIDDTNPHAINRIVLYIDDLDRCSEAKVVEVLRAVHLLLAFPAFVVVVAVDARWIEHCLKRELPLFSAEFDGSRLQGARQSTPLDYLEKIFQIPIWLEPMTAKQRANMATALLSGKARPTPQTVAKPAASSNSKSTNTPAIDTPVDLSADRGVSPPPRGAAAVVSSRPVSTRDTDTAALSQRPRKLELAPAALEISEDELKFISVVSPLLSTAPRMLKRYVNTYRLFKATQAERKDVQSGQVPDFELCLLLLCVFVDMPMLSRELQRREANELTSFSAVLQEIARDTTAPDALRVLYWLKRRNSAWQNLAHIRVAERLPQVARYTFNFARAS